MKFYGLLGLVYGAINIIAQDLVLQDDSKTVSDTCSCESSRIKTQCACPNGTGVIDWDCDQGSKTECFKCNSGYTLSNGSCVLPLDDQRVTSHTVFETEEELESYCLDSVFDLTVIVDGSGSVDALDYHRSIDFVDDLIRPFNISPTTTRVTLIQFSESAFYYTKFSEDRSDVSAALLRMRNSQRGLGTETNEALSSALSSIQQNGRQDVKQYLIILTDGESNNGVSNVHTLHEKGIIVFALGIGEVFTTNFDAQSELQQLASDPDAEYQYEITNASALSDIQLRMVIGSNVCIHAEKFVDYILLEVFEEYTSYESDLSGLIVQPITPLGDIMGISNSVNDIFHIYEYDHTCKCIDNKIPFVDESDENEVLDFVEETANKLSTVFEGLDTATCLNWDCSKKLTNSFASMGAGFKNVENAIKNYKDLEDYWENNDLDELQDYLILGDKMLDVAKEVTSMLDNFSDVYPPKKKIKKFISKANLLTGKADELAEDVKDLWNVIFPDDNKSSINRRRRQTVTLSLSEKHIMEVLVNYAEMTKQITNQNEKFFKALDTADGNANQLIIAMEPINLALVESNILAYQTNQAVKRIQKGGNVCLCRNGQPVDKFDCTADNSNECSFCYLGYHLVNNDCIAINNCQCNFGYAVAVKDCSINGAESCLSCWTSYELVLGSNGLFTCAAIKEEQEEQPTAELKEDDSTIVETTVLEEPIQIPVDEPSTVTDITSSSDVILRPGLILICLIHVYLSIAYFIL